MFTEAIDSDDFYQYLGGTTQAVRAANSGSSVQAFVSDLSHPTLSETVTLQHYMGRELRARYLNPKWIEAMLSEGYAGSRMIRQTVDNLWGWQVTVPEAVDQAKWQELFETYVEDRHQLDIHNKFEQSQNLAAFAAIIKRMQSVIAKGYWTPSSEVTQRLEQLAKELQPRVDSEQQQIATRAAQQSAPNAMSVTVPTDTSLGNTSESSSTASIDQLISPSKSPLADEAPGKSQQAETTENFASQSSSASLANTQQLMDFVQGFAIETTMQSDSYAQDVQTASTSNDEFARYHYSIIAALFAVICLGWINPWLTSTFSKPDHAQTQE